MTHYYKVVYATEKEHEKDAYNFSEPIQFFENAKKIAEEKWKDNAFVNIDEFELKTIGETPHEKYSAVYQKFDDKEWFRYEVDDADWCPINFRKHF